LESSRGHEPAEIHRHFHDGGQSYNSQLHPMDPIPIPEQRSQAKPCDAPAAFLARFKTTARTADVRLVAPELILRLSQSGNTGFWLLLQKPNSLRVRNCTQLARKQECASVHETDSVQKLDYANRTQSSVAAS